MSLDLEQELRVFLASSPQRIRRVQTLEVSHSAMSQTWNLWREPYVGTTTVNGIAKTMLPANFESSLAGSTGNLDQIYDFAIGFVDAFDTFRNEIKRIPLGTKEKVALIYREFLSDSLDDVMSQATLQVESVAWQIGVAKITAISPRLNTLRTGEVYSPRTIPMLRGFI